MVKIYVGCAGWDYKDWTGPFYPKFIDKSEHLEHYAKYFDIVEINSTFYNLPSEEMVKNWGSKTPDTFRFIVKMWQKVTHDKDNENIESFITQFYYRLRYLKEKTFKWLLQFPPWFNYNDKHLMSLKYIIKSLPSEFEYVIELRDNSWYNEQILSEFIDGKRSILGTTYMPNIIPYYYTNQESHYIRLIGDRELTVFNRIQRKQEKSMNDLKKNILELKEKSNIREIFIIVNNHFAGFSPQTANAVKEMLDLPLKNFQKQKSISDFF